MQDSRKQHGQWLAHAEKNSGALHKITKPPPRRETDIHTGKKTLRSPKDMLDHETTAFTRIWTCGETPHDEHTKYLTALRDKAIEDEGYEPWTLEDLDRSIKGEPDKG
eukprot:6205020-Pyramimonas_sp.AAC.1